MLVAHLVPGYFAAVLSQPHWNPEWGRRIGLGEEFLSCVEAITETIRRTPEMYEQVYKSYRRGLVRRFPYTVLYGYVEGTVTVYGVLHLSRSCQMARAPYLSWYGGTSGEACAPAL